MTTTTLYRTLAALAFAGLLILPACASTPQKPQKTMKQEQYDKWNAARIGVLFQLAKQQYEVGEYDKCKETLATAGQIGLPHQGLQVLAAKVDFEKGSLEAAVFHLNQAIALEPKDPEPYYLLGIIHQRWQKNQLALDNYQAAYDRKPTEVLYLLAVVEMKIALGQHDAAQKLLEEKLGYFEQTAAVRVALAKLAAIKGDHAAAAKYLREASIFSPEDISIRQNYAEALYFSGQFSQAARTLEDLKNSPDLTNKDAVTMLLGQTYLVLHRGRDARTCFAELTRAHPNDMQAWLNLGKATLALEDYGQAISLARKVLKSEPDNLHAMIVMAVAQEKLKQSAQAQATLLKALQVAPDNTTILCLLGLNAKGQGKTEVADDYFRKALDTRPDDKWAKELLAASAGHVTDR